jgi:hypothetical protein
VFQIPQRLSLASRHEDAAACWQLTGEAFEDGCLLHPFVEIGPQHRELIEVPRRRA